MANISYLHKPIDFIPSAPGLSHWQWEDWVAKILCVDDEPALLRIYQDELSGEGYEVIVARDGKEALALLSAGGPQVVILDIRMPNMDGLEALVALLGKNHTLPVILHSAYPEYKESFITAGAEAFVLKSSDLTELKRTIRKIVDRGIEAAGISAERPSKSGKRSP
jgi:two-component system, response regulator, stage 0 sporulation protein F